MNLFIETITSPKPETRNRSFEDLCKSISAPELFAACYELDKFRRSTENLYEQVRATLFLYALYRFYLQESPAFPEVGVIPHEGFQALLSRRFEEAINSFSLTLQKEGPNGTLLSALAQSYHQLAFQTLSDQVRRSVRASRGNQWMFRVGHADDHPVRIRHELLQRANGMLYPILVETTPVRLDLSHSGWSDIFFLGMDYPEGARVLNISVNLGVYGRDDKVRPPIETYIRVIPEPLLRLTSIDLEATKNVIELRDLFNFGNDYLSLLKAGVIASGLIPPSLEGTDQTIAQLLEKVVGPGMGLELVTKVNDIPKGSRLAVSTNLLVSIISVLMRVTGQIDNLQGALCEEERRLVASRAILGEWLGGSGGGWQDSGGTWPGFKVIEGVVATEFDPEFGISRGRLLPQHHLLGEEDLHPQIADRLAKSLVLIHGGMAQNVGPILEMVTEKYLLRSKTEWQARLSTIEIFDNILASLKEGNVKKLSANTTLNWNKPLKTIIPWVTNRFTESIICQATELLGDDFWGFLMLGGMSGGGMAMFVAPERQTKFRDDVRKIMAKAKTELEEALAFAMDPVVYNFDINKIGTVAHLLSEDKALMPSLYYGLQIPELIRHDNATFSHLRHVELDQFTARCDTPEETHRMLRCMIGHLFNVSESSVQHERSKWDMQASQIKVENGFDSIQHEQIRADMQNGRIGLAHNRLPVDTKIEDVRGKDVLRITGNTVQLRMGESALREGRVAVMSLAAGVGSRWTTGAGVIKAVNPFVFMAGQHRSFLEIHVHKTRKTAEWCEVKPPHIVSTSYLTHGPIEKHLRLSHNYGYDGSILLSPGRSIGQRFVPMQRDLVFLWETMPQETLDEQKQKVRDSIRNTLMEWAHAKGEGSDYVDNIPIQRFNPPGHWYELANIMRNGVLARILCQQPQLDTIMLHNIDTLGADLNPEILGTHLESGNILSFEVVPRRIEDRGGGLARVNGQVRLLEGLAQPREEDELRLSYYNSMTTWIQIDPLLNLFGLTRKDLNGSEEHIAEAVRNIAQHMPTYVTIKEVKRRWGHGQEDVFPVAQCEKLWSDMTALIPAGQGCGYIAVPRIRGQQLKAPEQLDAWANDGSKEYIARLSGLE